MTMQEKAFLSFMEEYAGFVEELAKLEETKYKALVSYDSQQVDRAISSQQAALMRLEGMEKQRESLQGDAGLGGLTFQQILEKAGDEQRGQLEKLFDRVSTAVMEIQFMNGKSMDFAKANMKELSKVLPAETKGVGYAPNKMGPAGMSSPLFETKI